MAKKKAKKYGARYWFCIIGPTNQDALPEGADGPLRGAVQEAYITLTGAEEKMCCSGWGVTEASAKALMAVLHATSSAENST